MLLVYCKHDASVPVRENGVVIAHIVNNRGDWGGGFTASLSQRYPSTFATYRKMIAKGVSLGQIEMEPVTGGNYICHMVAQDNLTPNRKVRVDYDALDQCLLRLSFAIPPKDLPVQMPRIGTGIGGGNWSIISKILRCRLLLVYVCDIE